MANQIDDQEQQLLREIQDEYAVFLDDKDVYEDKIKRLIADSGVRLIVNINDVRKTAPKRAAGLLQNGFQEIGCFQRALKDAVTSLDTEYSKQYDEFFIGFEGSFGQRHVNPRTLKSSFLCNMVCCEGIVTKCSLVRPKVVRSVHYCPATKKTIERRYADVTAYDAFPTSSVYPTKDEAGNAYETEFGLSTYKDHQMLTIQEMPESAPPGQLPRSVDVVLDNDLVDRSKPGDRIRVIGLYRCLPSKQQGFTAGTFRTVLIANNIQLLSKESAPMFSKDDIDTIRKFSKMPNAFKMLARSLAPSIHGHEQVKEAILCLLIGGTERVLANGTRLRGDINILLVGDPSVAKSQLLRYVLHTAPRAIPTTGRGSSGVGLTAAVTTDPETGDRRLEAGAMVLADRGVVCIDEFDKMSDIDRTAIHEVMEQGRVTIAKAGIQARLNARCSVLAAANPVYGRYDQTKNPMANIGMQDSLLSRFDLIFILLDKQDKENDGRIAEHVVDMHKYRAGGEEDGAVLPMGVGLETLATEDLDEVEADENGETQPFEQTSDWLPQKGRPENLVGQKFMRKYIHVAKNFKTSLSTEAAEIIGLKYAELRSSESQKGDLERTTPVTARTLETLIRLSTAFAKARLSKTVTKEDANNAFKLMHYACFKEKAKDTADQEDMCEEDENMPEDLPETVNGTAKEKRKRKTKADVYEFEDRTPQSSPMRRTRRQKADTSQSGVGSVPADAPAISVGRYGVFRKLIRCVFDKSGFETLALTTIYEEAKAASFTDAEVKAALESMCDDNAAMIADEKMILI